MPGRSGIVPTALEAAVTATQRVRSPRTASTALAGSSSVPCSGSAKRTRAPARAAWIGAEQRADSRAGAVDELVDALRGTERAAVVGVVARSHEGRHGLDRVVDH